MEPRTLANFGGPYSDADVVQNPETQISAELFNRMAEDTAQLTRTPYKAVVRWLTHNASPVPPTQVFHKSLWGSDGITKPVVTRTGTGLYTITYSSSFTDGVGELENVSFWDAHVTARSGNAADNFAGCDLLTVSSNVVSVILREGGAAADQGAGPAYFYATAWIL